MQPTTTLVNSPGRPGLQQPTVHLLAWSRVGVTNVEKVIRISRDDREELYWAKLECFVDLGAQQKGGAHVALRGDRQRRDRRGDPRIFGRFRAEELRGPGSPSSVRERQDAKRARW